MDSHKINELNQLFEKMMAEKASTEDKYKLKNLYSEYIDDGRGKAQSSNTSRVSY